MSASPRRVAALFDIDGTILAGNSAASFARYMREIGVARRRDLALAGWYLGLYWLGLLRPGQVLDRSTETLRGKPESWLVDHCGLWYERDVRPQIRPLMRTLIDAHREAGHLLALLSSSTRYLGDPLGEELGLEHRLVNRLELDDHDRFTGRFVKPLCYGAGKVVHATAFAEAHDADLSRSYFYTDSITDLAVLEIVGHPRVVAPDPRLAREARRRGWTNLDLATTSVEAFLPGAAEARP